MSSEVKNRMFSGSLALTVASVRIRDRRIQFFMDIEMDIEMDTGVDTGVDTVTARNLLVEWRP